MNQITRLLKRAALVAVAFGSLQAHGQSPVKITVAADKPGARISPHMWGIFFEDINFAADGGLYAELVKNRSFEFPMPMMGWKQSRLDGADATLLVVNRSKTDSNNPRYAQVDLKSGKGKFVLTNEGFRGIGVEQDHAYNFSIMAHAVAGDVSISADLVDEKGAAVGHAEPVKVSGDWKTYKVKITAKQTVDKGKLNVVFEGKGNIDIDMISLFPEDTWKHRPGGLRADLAQKLADLHPGFMRFPGGCIVEGRELLNRYQWKKTVGDVAERELIMNRWNVEFSYRNAPDYYQSFGLGFFEYFQLCEDIGASPLPILNCGMACQFNSGEVVSVNHIDPYIQDALDLIEFANGATSTKWGALRAKLGHPQPFNLKMIGVGNEQWGEQYVERFKLFSAQLKKAYPDVKLVTSTGPDPDGDRFNYLTETMRAEKAGFIDEHYYRPPEWFLKNASRYDNYERGATKIFAGEYACHIPDASQKDARPESHNTIWAAVCEAALMTGLERNADVVQMASYAPLFARVDAWQWRPDLIWFDNLHSVATPNYYVQQLYASHRGTAVVPALINGKSIAGQDSLYSSATIDAEHHQLIIKLVNTSASVKTVAVNVAGKATGKKAAWIQLTGTDKLAFNSMEHPEVIKPSTRNISWTKENTLKLEGLSVNVFVVGL